MKNDGREERIEGEAKEQSLLSSSSLFVVGRLGKPDTMAASFLIRAERDTCQKRRNFGKHEEV